MFSERLLLTYCPGVSQMSKTKNVLRTPITLLRSVITINIMILGFKNDNTEAVQSLTVPSKLYGLCTNSILLYSNFFSILWYIRKTLETE